MARGKYRFRSRAEAELACQRADRKALLAEWLATAIIRGTAVDVGQSHDTRFGYIALRHTGLVFAISKNDDIHAIRGCWDIDTDAESLSAIARAFARMEKQEDRDNGLLMEKARTECYRAMMAR